MKKLLNIGVVVGSLALVVGCAEVETREEAPLRPVKIADVVAPETEARLR